MFWSIIGQWWPVVAFAIAGTLAVYRLTRAHSARLERQWREREADATLERQWRERKIDATF